MKQFVVHRDMTLQGNLCLSGKIKQAFADLGRTHMLEWITVNVMESFVCSAYQSRTTITSVSVLSCWTIRRQQAEPEILPQTRAALVQHL